MSKAKSNEKLKKLLNKVSKKESKTIEVPKGNIKEKKKK